MNYLSIVDTCQNTNQHSIEFTMDVMSKINEHLNKTIQDEGLKEIIKILLPSIDNKS